MIKTILIGLGCFLVALAASTSVMVMRTPAKSVAADSTAVADSLLHAAGAKGAAAAAAGGTAGGAPGAGTKPYAPEGEFAADAPLTTPDLIKLAQAIPHQAEPVPAERRPEHVEVPSDFGRVGKILMNMKATEAAAILAYLGDPQVEGVLRSLGPRQAATILAALPTERAAQLSKRLLVVPPEEKMP